MRVSVLCLLILGLNVRVMCQEDSTKLFHRDFFLKVDNDAFLAQAVDRYYSSGIFFQFRKHLGSNSILKRWGGQNATKAIYSINFSHLFFTPSDLKLRTIDQFDRPYAGMMSAGVGVAFFYSGSDYIKIQLDGGILGPGAGVEELQEWYHRLIGAKTPHGWRFQIENSPVVTLNVDYARSFWKAGRFELFTEGALQAGTVFNNFRPGVAIRWGKFQALDNSSFKASRLGTIGRNSSKKDQYRESYFFANFNMGYIFYDATIEGGLLGEESIHTEEAQRWRYHIKYGWAVSLRRWDFALSFNNVRRETRESRDHYYMTIDLLMRF